MNKPKDVNSLICLGFWTSRFWKFHQRKQLLTRDMLVSMKGMSNQTGRLLSPQDHLQQSIADILSTPLGSRVLLRDYGSDLYQWVDAPLNPSTQLRIIQAVAVALKRWEPRYDLQQVEVIQPKRGSLMITLTGRYHMDKQPSLQRYEVALGA
jgi:phage baseplate assembly protein W